MTSLEPVPDEPAATADLDEETVLVIADYHAGVEAALARERGVEIDSRARQRRERLLELLATTGATRLVVLGDLMHSIGAPTGAERGEIEVLVESLPSDVEVILTKGNHDGDIESWVSRVDVTAPDGRRLDDLGIAHGHTWPNRSVLAASTIAIGHEHPQLQLEDAVGGHRIERAWLRGALVQDVFDLRYDDLEWGAPELVVFPAYNELVGGTWINVAEQDFLAPFLPEGLDDGQAYLLDGTWIGDYRSA